MRRLRSCVLSLKNSLQFWTAFPHSLMVSRQPVSLEVFNEMLLASLTSFEFDELRIVSTEIFTFWQSRSVYLKSVCWRKGSPIPFQLLRTFLIVRTSEPVEKFSKCFKVIIRGKTLGEVNFKGHVRQHRYKLSCRRNFTFSHLLNFCLAKLRLV